MVASQPWRLPKEKRRRKKGTRKTKDETENSSTNKEVTEKTASSGVPLVPTVNTQIDSDFVRVSASRYDFTKKCHL